MEEAWQKEPSRRPDFTEINKRLNHILIETAIDDFEGQFLWRAKFLTAKKLQVRRGMWVRCVEVRCEVRLGEG